MADSNDAIAAFWRAWPDLRRDLTAAIDARDPGAFGDLPQRINEFVNAIHERLEWELGPGHSAEHAMCVTAVGDPELRVLAERWVRAAPEVDETWEFHAARQPRRDLVLQIAGHDIDPADMRFEVELDEARERAHVGVFHPAFPEMEERLRGTITFLTLDGWFGEDGVERWLGGVEPLASEPADPKTVDELTKVVDGLAASATGERWALLRGEAAGVPLVATVNLALKRIDHLLATMRCELRLDVLSPGGTPSKQEADELNAIEDELLAALPEHVAHLGRTTSGGVRTIVFYAPESSGAAAVTEALCARHLDRHARAEWSRDLRWEYVRRFG